MSRRARLWGIGDRMRITAPRVPSGDRYGRGMKYGSEAFTPHRRAAK